MQPPAASMEADVKESPMLILNILLKCPIIAKLASRLQPQAACMERLLKPPRMVMPKKILTLIHYCALFDRFLNCSLKRPP